jgi:uncharacterized protein
LDNPVPSQDEEPVVPSETPQGLIAKLRGDPTVARVAPFFIFVGLTACQGLFGDSSKYWLYVAKSLVGLWLIWAIRPVVREIRWTISFEAILVGVGVIVIWIAADPFYPKLTDIKGYWNPHQEFGQGTSLAWFFIVARILFSALVVPPIEEMFYRSFIYRYIVKQDFEHVSLKTFHLGAFLITSSIFGLVHREWLAGILCGAAYQWLVLRRGHLGDAITAHAISNLLLGIWVAYKGAWHFW